MLQEVPSYLASFIAGVLSFLTPCVLPLVPGYISFISGVSLSELTKKEGGERRARLVAVLLSTLCFVLGFSLIFMVGGATAFTLGRLLGAHKDLLIRLAGVIIIIMGLHMAGAFRIEALYREKRFGGGKGGSLSRAFLLGLAFAFGWTPCVGPILGGILGLAAKQETAGRALILMGLYCLGLGIPFFLTGLAVDEFFRAFDRIKTHFRKIEIGAGVLLVLIGLMMVINRFGWLKDLFNLLLPESVNYWG